MQPAASNFGDQRHRRRGGPLGMAVAPEQADTQALLQRANLVADRAVLLHVRAWDINCRQHIPRRYVVGL